MIWQIDPTHSHVSFAVRVLSVSTRRLDPSVIIARLDELQGEQEESTAS